MKKNSMKQKLVSILLILVLAGTIPLLTAFSNKEPETLYRVYLKGESNGLIKSKEALEDYIDKRHNQIKENFGVNKVYLPEALDIEKEITFDDDVSSIKEIYKKIENISPFTIKGYEITIGAVDSQAVDGTEIKGKKQKIYVLDKKIFEEAVDNIVHSFVSEEDYENYANGTQEEIKDVGKVIESISIENKITIKRVERCSR